MTNSRRFLVLAVGVLCLSAWASAASVGPRTKDAIVTGSDLSAYLSTEDGGMTGTGFWSGSGDPGFKIAWNITPVVGGYSYSYAMTGEAGEALRRAISHFVLELTDPFTGTISDINSSATVSGQTIGYHEPGSGNPDLPSTIYGLKIDLGGSPTTLNFSFVSNRVPVWGNFYAKDGNLPMQQGSIVAYNTGMDSGSPGYFVARPDSAVVVPLPAAAWMGMMLLGGVGGAGFIRRRRPVEA
jgi:hypothetical protein